MDEKAQPESGHPPAWFADFFAKVAERHAEQEAA